jgi:hypothetical protein
MKLAQVRKHALSLPGVTEEPHFDRTSFRVGGKIFVTARPAESHIHVFVPEEYREPALALHADHVSRLLWGGKVVGLRVELAKAPVAVVNDLVKLAWESKAPARPVPRLRKLLSKRLGELGVEERAWPGRDDGFCSLLFDGEEFAHFHSHDEIDIRLGKTIIQRERLVHPADSIVHPTRSPSSPWYEMKIRTNTDVKQALRLVQLALKGITRDK